MRGISGEIIENLKSEAFAEAKCGEGQLLYAFKHLSSLRGNILSWYPFKKGASVLELRGDWGAVTRGYIKKVEKATVITENYKSDTLSNILGDPDNLTVLTGIPELLIDTIEEKFDYIIHAGGALSEEFLLKIKSHLKKGGKLLIATDNRNGVKFLAGCRDEESGEYYLSVEGYKDKKLTLDKPEWEKLLSSAGFKFNFRYPYPDWRFCDTVYSDLCLPKENQLSKNAHAFGGERVISFDETAFFNTLINYELFPLFSNSFFIETGEKTDVRYVKFSTQRSEGKKVYTVIGENVAKYAADMSSCHHIDEMANTEKRLQKIFSDKFYICPCELYEDRAEFPFIKGETLSSLIDKDVNDKEKLYSDLDILKETVKEITSEDKFTPSEAFLEYFGDVDLPEDLHETKISLIDLIADNIIVNDKINLIDYEWTLPFPIPSEFILFRSVFLSAGISTISEESKKEICKYLGINYELWSEFLKMEFAFQKNVSSKEETPSAPAYSIRLLDLRSAVCHSSIVGEKTGKVYSEITHLSHTQTLTAVPENENLIFSPSELNVFMHMPEFYAVKDGKEIVLPAKPFGGMYNGEDLLFAEKPRFLIENDGYSEVKVKFTSYLWDSSLVPLIMVEKEKILSLSHELAVAQKWNVKRMWENTFKKGKK